MVGIIVIAVWPTVPVHSLVEVIWRDVEVVAVHLHHLAWGSCRLAEFSFPLVDPTRFDVHALMVGNVLYIPIDVKSNRESRAYSNSQRFVSEALACITLNPGLICATALVRSSQTTLWFVRVGASVPSAVTSVRTAALSWSVVTAVPKSVRRSLAV